MLVLITGATGFVGRHLVERLVREGHACRALVRSETDVAALESQGVSVVRGSLADEYALREAARDAEAVVHLAGSRGARTEAEMLDINARGTARLAEASLAAAPSLRRFVYVSTLAATPPQPAAPRGSARPRALSRQARRLSRSADVFGRSKRAGERRLLELAERLPVTVLRVPRVYGPGDRTWLPMTRAAKRHLVPLPGAGQRPLRLVYVEDLCDAIVLALTQPHESGQVLYIGGERQVTLRDLKRAVAGVLGVRARPLPLPRWLYGLGLSSGLRARRRPLGALALGATEATPLDRCQGCSPREAEAALGWRPQTSLSKGLETTIEWYRDQGLV